MIRIREAEISDVQQILDIYNDAILHTTAVYDYQPHTLEMRMAWLEDKNRQGLPVLVAYEDEEILGFASIGPFRAWAAYRYSVENSLYVKEGHRGKGIGKLLLNDLIGETVKREFHTIIAGIDATNIPSIRLHESFGFREVAHFREAGYKFGRWLDLKFMQLILKTPAKPVEH